MRLTVSALILVLPLALWGQEQNPAQASNPQQNGSGGSEPIYKVQVVSRSIPAVSYRNRSGWSKIDFQGTTLAPKAHGTAEVESQLGHMNVKVDIKNLPSPRDFGSMFLTYVLWAITPDGHTANLGEIVVDSHGDYKGEVTTELQAFGLIVTAEPYFAVREPSDVVVMENVLRKDTIGKYEVVNANYHLLTRSQYTYNVPVSQQHPIELNADKKSPLELYEAMNAVQIARYAKANQYGGQAFQDAENLLRQAEDYTKRKQWKPAIMTSREAIQKAEDARIVSLRTQQEIAQQQEREEAAARQAAAQKRAEEARLQAQQAQLQAQEEARRQQQAEEQARIEAQQRAAAEQAKREAEEARAQAAAEAQRANQAAAEAERLRQQAVQERNQLREQLLQQFNSVLPTRETPRGLVVNMQDVLFATGKYNLTEPAREALAKIAGIVISHPGLNLRVEGYTDSTGTEQFNQKLSEERANTVRDYLVSQGLNPQSVTAVGYGEAYPVASNDTAAGRRLNRRVELVVSGEVIGVKIGVPPSQGQGQNPTMSPTSPTPPQTSGQAPGPGLPPSGAPGTAPQNPPRQ